MIEQISSIGIESELKNVRSENDRVDAMFAVATGPMGNQEVNYHFNNDERDRHTIRQSQLIDTKMLKDVQEILETKKSDNHERTTQFSLPENDTSNRQEKVKPSTTFNPPDNKPLKSTRKSQPLFNPLRTHISEEKLRESSIRLTKPPLEIPERCHPEVNQTLQHQFESLLPFYTIHELAEHNHSTDAWICIFTQIYDITSLIKKTQGTSIYQQLIDFAGQDISLWFDEQTHEPRQRIDPYTHQSVLVIPNLSIVESFGTPFWRNNDLVIGRLTKHSRYIRLLHTSFPKQPYLLEVAEEETVGQIARKFSKFNSHIFSYIWQYNGRILDFNRTLTENGLVNEESFHDEHGWRSDDAENCPTILLYFIDDLTIA